jgi:beta-fructofuranosidase
MALHLPDHWVWDFWHVADGDTHHLFFLKAPRSLGDPDLRHWHPAIGHAVSPDLRTWTVLPDALAPTPPPAWDDHTTWTGSVVRFRGRWHLFYTGTSRADDGLVQRIGHAESADLVTWERAGEDPAFELDERWYDTLDLEEWHDQAWRDPFLIHHGGEWHALVTARRRGGHSRERGTIGHATSADLVSWTVRPPLTEGSPFGHLEIPAVHEVEGRWYLLFSTSTDVVSPNHVPTTVAPTGAGGTFAVPSTGGPLGPWDWDRLRLVLGDGWYGVKLIDPPALDGAGGAGDVTALAWRERGGDGHFGGWISDPMPVVLDADGFHVAQA